MRQTAGLDREAGAMGNSNMRQRKNIAPAMPRGEPGKGIGADQQNQRLLATQFAAQALQRMDGIARCGGFDFAGIDLKSGIFCRRP